MLCKFFVIKPDYASFTLMAFKPLSPFCISKTTWSFSRIEFVFSPEECTNISLLPSAGAMNPKPFASLKNFTVPCCMVMIVKIIYYRDLYTLEIC